MNPENLVLTDRTGNPIGSDEPSEADRITDNLSSISSDLDINGL